MKKPIGTIDMTPTWEGLMPGLIAMLQDGSPAAQQTAREELTRLAKFADQQNAKIKAEKAAKEPAPGQRRFHKAETMLADGLGMKRR